MTTASVRLAWAIEFEPSKLAGVFFFAKGPLEPWHDGVRTAVFATRKQARTAFDAKFRGSEWYPKAKVVRVKLAVIAIGKE